MLSPFLEKLDFALHLVESKSKIPHIKLEILNLELGKAQEIQNAIIKLSGKLMPDEKFVKVPLREKDWEENWKLHFKARRIAPHIVVRPEWENYKAFSDDAVLVINPGMAFGTGLHETTRSVLQMMDFWFEKYASCARNVLDVGTGSGIVAIAAAKLGARYVEAIDCDVCSVKSAIENIRLNGVENIVNVSLTDVACFKTNISFDLIIANILAGTLIDHAHKLVNLLSKNKNATILLSGILKSQFEKVAREYTTKGLVLTRRLDIKEWSSGEFRR